MSQAVNPGKTAASGAAKPSFAWATAAGLARLPALMEESSRTMRGL